MNPRINIFCDNNNKQVKTNTNKLYWKLRRKDSCLVCDKSKVLIDDDDEDVEDGERIDGIDGIEGSATL